jgi:hypothetical protein
MTFMTVRVDMSSAGGMLVVGWVAAAVVARMMLVALGEIQS